MKKYLAADLLRAVTIFPGGVFFHKGGVRYSSAPADTVDHLCRVFRIKERIFPDILIHTPAVLIFLAVIGKKDDRFPGVGKIIKNAGIICDQRTAQAETLIGIPLRRKGPDMAVTIKIFASVEERMKFDQQYFVIVKAFIPYPQMTVQNIHILPVIYAVHQTPEGWQIHDDLFPLQSLCSQKPALPLSRFTVEDIIPGISFMKNRTSVKSGQHIGAGHHLFHEAVWKNQVIGIQQVPENVTHAHRFRPVVPSHFLQRRTMPCIQIDLSVFFYESSRESGIVHQVPGLAEGFIIGQRPCAHSAGNPDPVSAEFSPDLVLRASVNRKHQCKFSVGVFLKFFQNRKDIALQRFSAAGFQKDHVFLQFCFFIE